MYSIECKKNEYKKNIAWELKLMDKGLIYRFIRNI